MSVCAKESRGERSLHSVSSLAWPPDGAGLAALASSSFFLGLGGGMSAALFGSKKPVGLPNSATSTRCFAACPASLKPAASATRGSVASVPRSALMRPISAFCSVFTSLVNWNSTGS